MPHPWTAASNPCYSQRICIVLALAFLSSFGCQSGTLPPQTDPMPERAPIVRPVEKPKPKPKPAPVPKALRIAVLMSCNLPAYDAVRDELIGIGGAQNIEIFELDQKATVAKSAIDSLRRAGHDSVIAVGLFAARVSLRLDAEKVVFCQVLNHAEYPLLGQRRHGVQALPPMDEAAELWRKLEDGLVRVGVITGDGHESTIAAARAAFSAHGVEILHRVVGSDKEAIVEFQRMLAEIDGYWLLPDNRVLSRNAIRDLMSLSRRAGIGVLVNDPRFLDMGAMMSAAGEPADIAACAYEVLLAAQGMSTFPGPEMTALRRSRIEIDAEVAVQLGYDVDAIPQKLLAR